MKIGNYLFLLILSFTSCMDKLAKDSGPLSYSSIDESKKNNAFVAEFIPQNSFIEFNGKKYFIENALIQHPYYQKNSINVLGEQLYIFTVSFQFDPKNKIDFHDYLSVLASSNSQVFFFLDGEKKDRDTLKLPYRNTIENSKKDKVFLFFRKKS